MRVVFLEFVTHFGGASRSSVELASRLSKHVSVSVVDPYGCCELFSKAVRDAGLDYHVLMPTHESVQIGGQGRLLRRVSRLAASVPHLVSLRRRALEVLQALQADVVCSNNAKSIFLAARLLPGPQPIPLVMFMRGWYTPDMIPLQTRWMFRRCAKLIAVSHSTATALRCSGVAHDKIRVVQNSVDIQQIGRRADRDLEGDVPQRHRPVRILLPAGLMKEKGQHTAVRAMRHVLDAGCDAVLWLAGDEAPGADSRYVPQTKDLARSLGVEERVVWLGLRHDVPQLMKAATVVILPTWSEGMSRAVLEAMALGRVVITTPVGGNLDLIMPEMTGLLFEVEDYTGLARQIIRVAADPAFAERLGSNARDYMRLNFSPDRQTERVLGVLSEATAACTAPRCTTHRPKGSAVPR